MYTIDEQDKVLPLLDFPRFSGGAPCPLVLADEQTLVLAAYLHVADPRWDGSYARMTDPSSSAERVAIVTFRPYHASMSGPPNDEAFEGHPLAARGLAPHGSYEIVNSSWIRALERMNRVHPLHSAASFVGLRHFVITFHDSTFECIAQTYSTQVVSGPLHELVGLMKKEIRR